MSIIIPSIEKYEVCEYNNKSIQWSGMSKEALTKQLANRKFTVVFETADIEEARKYIQDNALPNEDKPWVYETGHLIIRFVFKEIEPDDTLH